jgi:hypothetical protein
MRCGSDLELKPLEVYYRNSKLYTPVPAIYPNGAIGCILSRRIRVAV